MKINVDRRDDKKKNSVVTTARYPYSPPDTSILYTPSQRVSLDTYQDSKSRALPNLIHVVRGALG